MKVIINGKDRDLVKVRTLEDVIAQISQDPRYVIAELNTSIVKKTEWPRTQVKEGDQIELVTFVGGG